MWTIISWAILGLIAGVIAKAIYPGDQGGGIFATIGLGIAGAFLGGILHNLIRFGKLALPAATNSLDFGSIIIAVIGAMVAIFIWGLIVKNN